MMRKAFWHPFRDLFVYVDFMLNLAHFWLPLGALWITLGSLLRPLGSLWLTFGSLLVPFGSLLVPWAHFWRSWRSIFSLLVPPSVIFHILFYNMDGVLVPKLAHRHLHALLSSPSHLYPSLQGPERNICLWQLRLIDIMYQAYHVWYFWTMIL